MKLKTRDELLSHLHSSYTIAPNGCWIWQQGRSGKYGIVVARALQPTPMHAHRFAYLLLKGPLPDRKHLHHICHNTLCVNPEHVLILSNEEHRELHREEAIQRRLKTCIHGHYDNWRYNSIGHRACRECDRIRNKKNRTKHKSVVR